MNWFEIALTSKDGDLYLSSDREFIMASQLYEDDPTIFFSIVGLLYDDIYKYKNIEDIGCFYNGYKLNTTYKKVKKEDYPNIKFAPELKMDSDDIFKPTGKKKYYIKRSKNYFKHPDDLKNGITYITHTGMIVRYENNYYDLIGTVSVDINKCDKELVNDWFYYHVDDLMYEEFNEDKWKKHYDIYYKNPLE